MTAVYHRQPDESRPAGLLGSRLVIAAGLLVFVLFVRAIGFVPAVINPDESIFALAAREVTRGHLPYLTLFDNKPVGSTLILAAAFELLGQSIVTTRLVGALFVWGAALGVFALAERGGLGRVQALFCALLYVVFTALVGGLATLTEILLTPFTILAVLLLQRLLDEGLSAGRRMMLAGAAGLACGGAILIKIVPVVPGFAVAGTVLLLLIARRQASMGQALLLGVVFAIGAVMPMIVAAGVYAAAGHLPDYLYSNFGFARAYAAMHPGLSLIAQRMGTMIDALWPLLGLAVVAVAVLASGWARHRRVDDLLLIAVAWLLGEIVAASASLQFFPHYFLTAVPPLVVMAGYAIRAIVGWIGAARVDRATLVLGGIVALIALERAEVDAARDITGGKDPSKPIAAAIREASAGHVPTLLVTSYKLAALYSMTGAPLPPTRYAVPSHLLTGQSAMTGRDPKVEVARVLASNPEFIVVDASEQLSDWASARLNRTLAERYRAFYAHDGVTVYRISSPETDRG